MAEDDCIRLFSTDQERTVSVTVKELRKLYEGARFDGEFDVRGYHASVTERTAHAIFHDEDTGTSRGHRYRTCSRCKTKLPGYRQYNFCPKCGTRLVYEYDRY
jgi:NADH pyrophosphatase NudC (nudix superfamily)